MNRALVLVLELAPVLDYSIGFCAPTEFLPETASKLQTFDKLSEGLEWADAVVALRVQKERHDNENIFLLEDYRENFGLNSRNIAKLKSEALIMHPGPINYGVEIEMDILSDKRCCILKQVENGVFLREALIRLMFES